MIGGSTLIGAAGQAAGPGLAGVAVAADLADVTAVPAGAGAAGKARPPSGAASSAEVGSAPPFVSIVMAVRDEARHIDDVLDALLAGTYPADRLEVVVADGGSTDGTAARLAARVATDPRVRCVGNPAATAAAGLNRAVEAARGDVIVRMDGHAFPAPDYVAACVGALARTGAAAVGGRMVGRGETPVGRAVAWVTATPLGAGDARYRLGARGRSTRCTSAPGRARCCGRPAASTSDWRATRTTSCACACGRRGAWSGWTRRFARRR